MFHFEYFQIEYLMFEEFVRIYIDRIFDPYSSERMLTYFFQGKNYRKQTNNIDLNLEKKATLLEYGAIILIAPN